MLKYNEVTYMVGFISLFVRLKQGSTTDYVSTTICVINNIWCVFSQINKNWNTDVLKFFCVCFFAKMPTNFPSLLELISW